MALDLEQLLAPVSEDEPAGPDLSYDSGRYEIEQAFETTVDESGTTTTGSEVDWRKTVQAIVAQSAQTKDVWLPVYLCRAGVMSGDLETLAGGAEYLARLLEQYWPTVHPQLEEYGFQGRKGPAESLTAYGQFIMPLQRLPLLKHPRLGMFSGADFERFRQNAEAEDGYGMFRAALEDTPDEDLTAIATRLDEIIASLKRADQTLTANAEGDTGPNFRPTYDALSQIKRAVQSFGKTPVEADNASEQAATGGESEASAGGARLSGRVDSREDVIKAIDAIVDYYRRREPGSPIPALMQRAREWVNMDFMAVLADIAPNALDDAKNVLQRRPSTGE